jgi:hypothetical protein
MQICVQIVLNLLLVSTSSRTGTQENINIMLSVRKLTFSPYILVLYDREQGKLFYV